MQQKRKIIPLFNAEKITFNYSLFQKFWQSAHFGQFLLKEKKYNQK